MRHAMCRPAFLILLLLPGTAVAADETTIAIGGRVTLRGTELAEARASLLPHVDRGPGHDRPSEAPIAETRTDARGRFRLGAPGVGMWIVRIEAAAHAVVELPVVPLLETTELPTVELAAAGADRGASAGSAVRQAAAAVVTVSGRVLESATGRPVPRALVWPAAKPGAAVRADARGVYELTAAAGSELRAAAPGFRLSAAALGADGPTIELRPAAAVSGVVVDVDGRPLDAVDVRAAGAYTRSSRRGRFTLSGLPVGADLALTFDKAGFARTRFEVEPLAPFEHRKGLRVTLARGRTGFGRVVDLEDRPVAEATVRLSRRTAPDGTAPATTDGDGSFEVAGLAPGRYRLEVEARGFAPAAVPGLEIAAGEAPFDLGTIVLVPGSEIAGRVSESRGEPIAGVEVHLAKAGALAAAVEPEAAAPHATTDATGYFRVGDLRLGEPVSLSFRKPGYLTESLAAVRVPAPEPLDVVLLRAARITGVVLGEDGEPVAGARVDAAAGSDHLRRETRETTTDSQGRFELDGVPLGAITLTADAEGYLPYRTAALRAEEGRTLEGVEVVLERGATLAGRVTAGGRPVAGARLSAQTAGGDGGFGRRGDTSDDGGRYRIAGVGVGRLKVVAEHEDFVRTVREAVIEAGENTLDVELESGSQLDGRVVEAVGGSPVAGALVTLEDPASRFHGEAPRTTSAADGSFTLRGIPAGSYRLLADKEGYARARGREDLTVGAGPVSGLRIELERGTTVSGEIRGLDFDDLAQVQIAARGPRGHGARYGQADYEGRYSIAGLTPGRWTIFAEVRATGRRAEETAFVEAGVPEMVVDLEFGDGFTLWGRALQAEVPVAGASIHLTQGLSRSGRAVTDPDGAFTIAGLEAGAYQLKLFQATTGLQHLEEVEIFADREVTIEVAGGWIAGHLRDGRDGGAIAGGHLTLEPAVPSAAARFRGSRVTSDSRGYFRLDGVPRGSWWLKASKSGYAAAEVPVEVPAGRGVGGLEVDMEPAAELTFEVVLDSGRVPAAVRLAVFAAGRSVVEGLFETTGGGRVRLDRVPAGQWQLALVAEDSAQLYLTVNSPGDLGRLRLPPAGRLEIVIPELASDESPAQIQLTGPDGRPFLTWDASGQVQARHLMVYGHLSVGRLRPGTWQVAVTAADGRNWSSSAEVAAAATTQLSLP